METPNSILAPGIVVRFVSTTLSAGQRQIPDTFEKPQSARGGRGRSVRSDALFTGAYDNLNENV